MKAKGGPHCAGNKKEKGRKDTDPEHVLFLDPKDGTIMLAANPDFLYQPVEAELEDLLLHIFPQPFYLLKVGKLVFVIAQVLGLVLKIFHFNPFERLSKDLQSLSPVELGFICDAVWPQGLRVKVTEDDAICSVGSVDHGLVQAVYEERVPGVDPEGSEDHGDSKEGCFGDQACDSWKI